MRIFGQKFKELRLSKGLTQKEIADEFEIRNTTVSEWEQGNSAPNAALLCKIADYFKVTPNELLGYEEIRKSDTSTKVPDIKKIG